MCNTLYFLNLSEGMVTSTPLHSGGFFPDFFPDVPMTLHPSPVPKTTTSLSSKESTKTMFASMKATTTSSAILTSSKGALTDLKSKRSLRVALAEVSKLHKHQCDLIESSKSTGIITLY